MPRARSSSGKSSVYFDVDTSEDAMNTAQCRSAVIYARPFGKLRFFRRQVYHIAPFKRLFSCEMTIRVV